MSGKRIRPGLSPPVAEDAVGDDVLTSNKSRKAEILSRYSEDEDMDRILDFDEDQSPEKYQDEFQTIKLAEGLDTLKLHEGGKTLLGSSTIKFSPSDSISTSSPIKKSQGQRRFLEGGIMEDFKEEVRHDNNDTDVTSELTDDEFEDVDNIFGDQESGIYLKMHDKLSRKKQQLQDQSRVEEIELEKLKATKQHHSRKLRTNSRVRNPNSVDQQERTVTFEESSLDDFENGFDNDIEDKITLLPTAMKLKQSLPNLQSYGKPLNTVKKFKSSMELISEHPKFNTSNRIYRKLNRIPSFYNQETAHPQDEEYVKAQERKIALLNKFKENSKHQSLHENHFQQYPPQNEVRQPSQINEVGKSTLKHKDGHRHNLRQSKKHVKHLIDLEHYQALGNTYSGPMKYNPRIQAWEGNDIELLKFDSLAKPSLITMNDLKGRNMTKKGSKKFLTLAPGIEPSNNKPSPMVFDSTNLRWVNAGDETDALFNVPDLEDEISPINGNLGHASSGAFLDILAGDTPPTVGRLQSPMRGVSAFTQRTTSSATTVSTSDGPLMTSSGSTTTSSVPLEEYNLSMKTINRFLKEETKIKRKVDNWFPSGAKYRIGSSRGSSSANQEWSGEHLWEIRKLVVDD